MITLWRSCELFLCRNINGISCLYVGLPDVMLLVSDAGILLVLFKPGLKYAAYLTYILVRFVAIRASFLIN